MSYTTPFTPSFMQLATMLTLALAATVAGLCLVVMATFRSRTAGMVLSALVFGTGIAAMAGLALLIPRYWWVAVPPVFFGAQALRVFHAPRPPEQSGGLQLRLSSLVLFVCAAAMFSGGAANLARQRVAEAAVVDEISQWIEVVQMDFDGMVMAVQLNGADNEAVERLVPYLKRLSALRHVQLNDPRISDAGLHQIGKLRRIRVLHLQRANVTDRGLDSLAGLRNLEQLDLMGTRVTDNGLRQLAVLRRLRRVWLAGTSVTQRGVDELESLLPGAEVTN